MDWTKVLKTPLPTVLVVLGCVLAVIAAAAGKLQLGNLLDIPPPYNAGGRIFLGSLGVLLCVAGGYLYLRQAHENGGKKSRTITFDETHGPSAPDAKYKSEPPIQAAALPELTMIRLTPECKSWTANPDSKLEFERSREHEFAEDPVFEITVENNSNHTLVLYEAGIRLLWREPGIGGTLGSWDYRTLEVHTELTVRCPGEWKQGVIDDRNSRASQPFVKPIEMNKGGSRYLFTLKLENFVDTNSASTSVVRVFLVTGNNRTAESESIQLIQ